MRPFFSVKLNSNHNITLIEKGQIICDDKKIALIFNDFFANAVKNANKTLDPEFISNCSNKMDPVLSAIEKYKYHPSILKIKETNGETNLFKCEVISLQSMLEQVSIIKTSKGSPLNAIPAQLIKEDCHLLAPILLNNFNNNVSEQTKACRRYTLAQKG